MAANPVRSYRIADIGAAAAILRMATLQGRVFVEGVIAALPTALALWLRATYAIFPLKNRYPVPALSLPSATARMRVLFRIPNMSLTAWAKGLFLRRGNALSLYRSGMAKAKKRNFNGAIADYSAAIQMANISNDVKAMAIFNRALAYAAIHEDEKSNEDLAVVLEIPGLPENIKAQARQRQERIRRRKREHG